MIRLHPLSLVAQSSDEYLFSFKAIDCYIEFLFKMSGTPRGISEYSSDYFQYVHDDPARFCIEQAVLKLDRARRERVNLSDSLRDLDPVSIALGRKLGDESFEYDIRFSPDGAPNKNALCAHISLLYDHGLLNIDWIYGRYSAVPGKNGLMQIREPNAIALTLLQAVMAFDMSRFYKEDASVDSMRIN